VKPFSFLTSPGVYVEIGQHSLKMLDGEDGLELSLDRLENGRLDPICADRLVLALRVFLKKYNWRPGVRAFCAIGARGVSMRRLQLPATSKEELQRLLPLQIEREFPLLPEELAWGYRSLTPEHVGGNGTPAVQELLVVAVKREVIEDYAEVLSGCGLNPVFTLGAWARSSLCVGAPGSYALLDIGRTHSELISFDNGVPNAIRTLPWGSQHDVELLTRSLQRAPVGQKLYLTGENARELAPRVANAVGSLECEAIELASGEGLSAAILGLKKSCEANGEALPLVLDLKGAKNGAARPQPFPWKWAVAAALLAVSSLGLRYAEAFLQHPRLAKRLTAMKSYRDSLPSIDRELSFFQYLKTNQPAYLEPMFVMANSAPLGTRIETLSMNRRGDLSLRASMKDSQQVVQFRSKLIESGLFSSVVVEEQTPSADRQKVVVRITGQWKPVSEQKYPELPREKLERPPKSARDEKPAPSENIEGAPPPQPTFTIREEIK
jgi:hypothetical protein